MRSGATIFDIPWLTAAIALVALALAWWSEAAPISAVQAGPLLRSELLAGQWWRLWTGHLMHFGAHHAAIDVLSLLMAGSIAEGQLGRRLSALAWLIGMPVLSMGLLVLAPDLGEYRGLSGMVVMLGCAAGSVLWRRERSARKYLSVLALLLLLRMGLDAAGIAIDGSTLPPDVAVVWQAHGLGILLGLGLGWIALRR